MVDIDSRESRQISTVESGEGMEFGYEGKFTFAPKDKIDSGNPAMREVAVSFGNPSHLQAQQAHKSYDNENSQ